MVTDSVVLNSVNGVSVTVILNDLSVLFFCFVVLSGIDVVTS